MKHFLQKYTLILLVLFYLVTRLLFLTKLPLFTDESIYIYWAKLIQTTHAQWFISLTDGKPPLLIWMIGIFLQLFPEGWYLLAGRLPSVIAGLFSLFAIWCIAGILFRSKKAQGIATLLYIVHPFTLFYDRMALFDSSLQAALLWSVYFALLTAKNLRLRDSLFWGVALGLGFLSKPTALLFVALTPLVAVAFSTTQHKKFPFKKLILLTGLAILIGEVINNLQRVSHVYFMAALKNSQFQQPLETLLRDPFQLTFGNLRGFFTWTLEYYTIPFLVLVITSFIFLLFKKRMVGIILVLLWLTPLVALATVGREIFPRYMLFVTPYALLAVAFFISSVWESKKKHASFLAASLGVLCLPLVIFSAAIIFKPDSAPLPPTDRRQYVTEHPSGYGLNPIFSLLNEKSKKGHITVVTQGTFGLYPYAFVLQYWNNPNVTIVPRWPLEVIDQDIIDAKKKGDVYIIFKEKETVPDGIPVKILLKAEKPGGAYPIFVTQLL